MRSYLLLLLLVIPLIAVSCGERGDEDEDPVVFDNGVRFNIPQALVGTKWTNEASTIDLPLGELRAIEFTADDVILYTPGAIFDQDVVSYVNLIENLGAARIVLEGASFSSNIQIGDVYSNVMEYNPALVTQEPTTNIFTLTNGNALVYWLTGRVYTNVTNI